MGTDTPRHALVRAVLAAWFGRGLAGARSRVMDGLHKHDTRVCGLRATQAFAWCAKLLGAVASFLAASRKLGGVTAAACHVPRVQTATYTRVAHAPCHQGRRVAAAARDQQRDAPLRPAAARAAALHAARAAQLADQLHTPGGRNTQLAGCGSLDVHNRELDGALLARNPLTHAFQRAYVFTSCVFTSFFRSFPP
jgi:hypothetical protein